MQSSTKPETDGDCVSNLNNVKPSDLHTSDRKNTRTKYVNTTDQQCLQKIQSVKLAV